MFFMIDCDQAQGCFSFSGFVSVVLYVINQNPQDGSGIFPYQFQYIKKYYNTTSSKIRHTPHHARNIFLMLRATLWNVNVSTATMLLSFSEEEYCNIVHVVLVDIC